MFSQAVQVFSIFASVVDGKVGGQDIENDNIKASNQKIFNGKATQIKELLRGNLLSSTVSTKDTFPDEDLPPGPSPSDYIRVDTPSASKYRRPNYPGPSPSDYIRVDPIDYEKITEDTLPAPCHNHHQPARRLNSYDLVNYNDADRTVPRTAAGAVLQHILDGLDNFEVVSGTATSGMVFDGTADQMTYELENGTVDGPFKVYGRFLQAHPNAWFDVDCPAKTNGNTCLVKATNEWLWSVGGCLIEDEADIADECKDKTHTIALNKVRGHHFVLSASSSSQNCPDVAFVSFNGGKHILRFDADSLGVPSHIIGEALLHDVLEAVASSPALTRGKFNFETNTCAHYAMNIWRALELNESDDLADFIIAQLLASPSVEEHTRDDTGSGIRYLAAKAGGQHVLVEYIKDLVYSQKRNSA